MFSTKNTFKDCSDDIVVNVQDSFHNFLTVISNTSGQIKQRSNLTLPYGCDKITTALKNFEMRYVFFLRSNTI